MKLENMTKITYKDLLRDFVEVFSDFERLDAFIEMDDDDGEQTYGLYDSDKKRIFLHREQSPYDKRLNLLHEFFHAYSDKHCLGWGEGVIDKNAESVMGLLYGRRP